MAFNEVLAVIGLALIALSAIPQIVFFLRRGGEADPLSHWILLAAGLALFGTIVARSIEIDFPAVTNTYEAVIFFSASLCIVMAVLRFISKKSTSALRWSIFGGTVIALALVMLTSSPIVGKDVNPPIPALHSYWLVLHVTMAFIGESFFAISMVTAIVYLLTKDDERKKAIDRIMYTTVMIGYPIYTAGALIFGAIWAEYAWGVYWSWDPKETWALITWLVYTAFLHTRFVMKVKGRVSAILSITGFFFTIFTFAGVNYLLAGLHSYAK
ncbi:MAG TPA: cytochrome c biogenesis protein CcsA [Rectinemataceae bacterium]|nr:cytochrome c biogenesis protein CcsA [Rectinemataceae bacterium]